MIATLKYQFLGDRSGRINVGSLASSLMVVKKPWFRRTKPRPLQKLLRFSSKHDSYLFLVRLGRASQNVIRRGTQITVEGFPRSGNTFAVAKLKTANPGIVVAHHLHSAAQVRRSVRLEVPTLILFRHPIDSLASWLHREPSLDLSSAARLYSSFYGEILNLRETIILSDFPETISALELKVNLLNEMYKTNFLVASDSDARDFMARKSEAKGNKVEYLSATSARERKVELDSLRDTVRSQLRDYSRLIEIYENLKIISNVQG